MCSALYSPDDYVVIMSTTYELKPLIELSVVLATTKESFRLFYMVLPGRG